MFCVGEKYVGWWWNKSVCFYKNDPRITSVDPPSTNKITIVWGRGSQQSHFKNRNKKIPTNNNTFRSNNNFNNKTTYFSEVKKPRQKILPSNLREGTSLYIYISADLWMIKLYIHISSHVNSSSTIHVNTCVCWLEIRVRTTSRYRYIHLHNTNKKTRLFKKTKENSTNKLVDWLVGFYGISTLVGYLTPNLFLWL